MSRELKKAVIVIRLAYSNKEKTKKLFLKEIIKLILFDKEVIFLNARFNLPFAFYLFEKTKNSYLFKDIW